MQPPHARAVFVSVFAKNNMQHTETIRAPTGKIKSSGVPLPEISIFSSLLVAFNPQVTSFVLRAVNSCFRIPNRSIPSEIDTNKKQA